MGDSSPKEKSSEFSSESFPQAAVLHDLLQHGSLGVTASLPPELCQVHPLHSITGICNEFSSSFSGKLSCFSSKLSLRVFAKKMVPVYRGSVLI